MNAARTLTTTHRGRVPRTCTWCGGALPVGAVHYKIVQLPGEVATAFDDTETVGFWVVYGCSPNGECLRYC